MGDVESALCQLREMWPDPLIFIGSGVHGGPDQRNWDDEFGTRLHTFIPRTSIVGSTHRQKSFFNEDKAYVTEREFINVRVLKGSACRRIQECLSRPTKYMCIWHVLW